MNSTFEQIEKKARELSVADRERLAQTLFESVHNKELTEIDHAWLPLAEERLAAYRSGDDDGIGEEDFFSRIQIDLGWR